MFKVYSIADKLKAAAETERSAVAKATTWGDRVEGPDGCVVFFNYGKPT